MMRKWKPAEVRRMTNLKSLNTRNFLVESHQFISISGRWTALYPPRSGSSCLAWIHYVLFLPARFLILLTVPDCREATNRKYWCCTLILSVVWVGTLSYLSSWMLTTFSTTLGFPNAITGIFLSFGASFPEILSSFIVARKGL